MLKLPCILFKYIILISLTASQNRITEQYLGGAVSSEFIVGILS